MTKAVIILVVLAMGRRLSAFFSARSAPLCASMSTALSAESDGGAACGSGKVDEGVKADIAALGNRTGNNRAKINEKAIQNYQKTYKM